MKHRAIALTLLLLCMVPMVHGFTIDGPTNFEQGGGIVRFDPQVTSRQYSIQNNIIQLNRFTTGGTNYGVLAFDAGAGVNMTVLSVTDSTVVYNVSCAGVGTTYVMYNEMEGEPSGTNTDNIAYDDTTKIATVTTTGNVVVTLSYHRIGHILTDNFTFFINFFPIVMIIVSLEMRREGLIGNRMLGYALAIGAVGVLIAAIRAMGL